MDPAPGGRDPCLLRDAVGNSVQPAGDRLLLAYGIRLAGEDEEGPLKSIFGVVVVAEHVSADVPHQPTVPADEHGKGVCVLSRGKAPQQSGIRKVPDRLRLDKLAQVQNESAGLPVVHTSVPGE